MRNSNARHRRYCEKKGKDAELKMLKDAWARYKETYHL